MIGYTISMRRSRLAVLLTLASVALLATACLPPYEGPSSGRKAVILGDSIVFEAGFSGALATTFHGRNWQISTEAVIAASTGSHMSSIIQAPGMQSEVVILNHATADVNGVLFGATVSKPALRANVHAALTTALDALANVPCVVFVTATNHGITPGFNDEANLHNAMLVGLVQTYPNATWLDWGAWSAGHPDWFRTTDGIHLTDAGTAALADIMEQTATSCGAW